jgi:small GTP-binding protein
MSDETEENNFKIVLVGESGVGKTSIISQFVDQIFEDDLQTSTGGSFSSKTLTFNNGKTIKLEIWDTAGQERYRALTKIFYKNALAAVLVYDITRKQSFEELKNYWIKQIKESAPENIILAIAANKSDLLDREQVNEDEARNFAKENNALFYETSAKNSIGVNELFIGIGKKFYGLDPDLKLKDDNNENERSDSKEQNKINENNNIKLNKGKINDKDNGNKKGCC